MILVQSGNINNAPIVSSPIADLSVDENSADVTIDLSLVFSDVEDATLSYMGSVVDSSIVAVSIDQSIATLAFPANKSGQTRITFTAPTRVGKSVSDDFLVTLGDFNAPPTDLILSNQSVDENSPNETLVGVLSVVDPDDTTHAFRLLNDAEGRFGVSTLGEIEVANGSLLDFESATSHDIVVEVSDGTNVYVELFTITVNNVIDGPAEPGLLGTYFDTISLTNPSSQRVDTTINFPDDVLGDDALGQVVSDDNYSIRWEGFVLTPEAGQWQFTTYSNDGVRLWVGDVSINATAIIDHWDQHKSTRDDATITLDAGWHPIRLEYFQQNGTTDIRLLFAGPGQSEVVIPSSNLSTGQEEEEGSQLLSSSSKSSQKPEEKRIDAFHLSDLTKASDTLPASPTGAARVIAGSSSETFLRSGPASASSLGLELLSDKEIDELFECLG